MSHVFGVQFIIDEKLLETKKFNSLLNETKELTAIFIASRKTARNNKIVNCQ